ncbi:hypothetical protein D3C79_1005170 [compost metagenome]
MGFKRRAEVHRAGFTRRFVTDGNDDIRRAFLEKIVAFAAQALNGNAGLLQRGQTEREHHSLGKAARTPRLESFRRQVIEHGF